MRTVTLITVLGLAAISLARSAPFEELRAVDSTDDVLAWFEEPDDANVALEARCGDLDSWQRRTCEESLVARFSSGGATPQDVVRLRGGIDKAATPGHRHLAVA